MYSDQNKSRGIEIDLCDSISPTSQIVTLVCGEFLMTVQLKPVTDTNHPGLQDREIKEFIVDFFHLKFQGVKHVK